MTEFMNKTMALVLCLLLGGPTLSQGQQPSGNAPRPQETKPAPPIFVPGATPGGTGAGIRIAPGIKILVLEGRRNPNRLTEGIIATPLVEVRDSNDQPVEGAKVTFILPGNNAAGATFQDGSLEKSFITNFQGQALAEGYRPTPIEGKFNVRVRAEFQEESTEILIPQSTTFVTRLEDERKGRGKWKKWALWGGIAAGGAIAAVILTRDSSATASRPTVIVTPGGPTIGGR